MTTSIGKHLAVAIALFSLAILAVGHGKVHADTFRIEPTSGTAAKNEDVSKVDPPFTATFVEDRQQVAIIEVSGDYDQEVVGSFNSLPRQRVAQEFYRHHPDDYDFLFIFSTFEYDTGAATAFHVGVQNPTQGIGLEVFDNSALMGSDGRLLGLVEMAALDRYDLVPDRPGFEDALVTMSHELMHQWCCYTDAAVGSLLGRDGSHWSYLLDSDASVMYGSDWRDNGDGTWTAAAVERFYSPLDLYLAGFYAADEVSPFRLLENPTVDTTQLPTVGDSISAASSLLDIADLIAVEGPRVPEASTGRELRSAFLLLTRPGDTVQESQLRSIDRLRRDLAVRFAVLTGGRGLLRVLPAELPGEAGQPTGTQGGDVRPPDQVDLEEAFTWLRDRQTPEGYWQDRPGTRLRDTTIALELLSARDPSFDRAEAALQWLAQQEEVTTDYLARTSQSLGALGAEASHLRTELTLRQRADGGWGLHGQDHSDAIDTALALEALYGHDDVDDALVDAASQFLIDSQGNDGGWGPVPGAPGRTGTTTAVLRSLHQVQRHGEVQDAATSFLAARQNPGDGGFGDSPSTSHDTASVLETMDRLGRGDTIDVPSAEAYLRQRQGVDGSWDSSVFATARALAALEGLQRADLAFDSVVAEPLQPSDGQLVELRITLRNIGFITSEAFDIELYDGPLSEATRVSSQSLQGLSPDQTVSLDMTWDSRDHSGSQQLFLKIDSADTVREGDETNNIFSLDVEVLEAPTDIDLALDSNDILISPPSPDSLPSEVAFSALVYNLGRSDANDVEVRLWAGEVDSGQLLAVQNFPLLTERRSMVANFVYPLQTATPPTLTFEVASPHSESNVDNNRVAITLTLDPTVDLALDEGALSLDPNPALFGSIATFSAEVFNHGTLATPLTEVIFRLSDGTTSQELDRRNLVLGAGQSSVETVTWNVNQLGELTFSAHLDEDGLLPESDESNNQASLTFTTTDVALADLTIASTVLPPSLVDGELLTIHATLDNQGGVTAPAHVLRLFDGDPSAGVVLAEVAVPSLLAGQSLEFPISWDTFGQTGSHTLTLQIDGDDTVPEVDEDNNLALANLEVTAPPSDVEIYLPAQGLQITPSEVLALPAPLTLQATVRNLGLSPADDLTIRWWMGQPSTGILLDEQNVVSLAARTDLDVNLAHALETVGTTTFTVEVLATATGDEADNNVASGEVVTVQGIDLRFDEPALTVDPDPTFIGQDVRFTTSIRNHGTVDSDTFQVRYLIDDGSERREIRSLALQIDAGETAQPSFSWRADRIGPLTLEVELDAGNLVAERQEDNNVATTVFTALDVTEPDLTFDLSALTFTPEPALEGSAVVLSTDLRNIGGGEAVNTQVTFYDGNPASGGSEIGSVVVPSLAVGSSAPVSLNWDAVPDASERLIYIVADPQNAIGEPNENNNLSFRELQVISLPDLAVSPSSLDLQPPFPVPGDTVTLTVTTANLGEQSSGPFAVRLSLADTTSDSQPLAPDQSLTLEGLADGQTVFTFDLPMDVDAATLEVQIDADASVIESREDNNQVELPLAFQDRDFFVSQRYFSPDGDGVQDSTRLFFQLPSAQTVSVQVVAPDGTVVRRQSHPQWTATLGDSFEWDGLDDLGRVVDDGVYTLQVVGDDGSVLGQAIAESDTNRSLLIFAAGNEFARYTNLTCDVGSHVVRFSGDEATVFIAVEGGSTEVPVGVHRMRPDGSLPLPIATFEDLEEHRPVALEVAPADDILAVEVERLTSHKVFVLSPDGDGNAKLRDDARLVGFSPAGEVIVVTTTNPVEILAIDPATHASRLLFSLPFQQSLFAAELAPDRSHLLVRNGSERWIVGIEGGAATPLPVQALCFSQWSGNSSLVVTPCAGSLGVDVFNTEGELVASLPVPIEVYPQEILPPGLPVYPPNDWLATPGEAAPVVSWSEDDQELLMEVTYVDASFPCGTGFYKALVHGDLASGVSTIVARSLPQLPPDDCQGEFVSGPDDPSKTDLDKVEPDKADAIDLTVLPDIDHVRWWIPDARLALVGGYGVRLDGSCQINDGQSAGGQSDGDCSLHHLFDEFANFRAQKFLPSGLALLFASNDATLDPESPCFGPSTTHTDTWTLRSLLNLTTELRVEYNEDGDLELRGTAADLNLERYFMEWTLTPSDAASWQLMAPPADQSVVDDILVPWIPPGPGLYSVRLTVVDLAGNRQQVVQQVSSSQTPSLINVSLAPNEISAIGGSSSVDHTEISYDVLQPVVLTFRVLDSDDRVVRSIVRVYNEAASDQIQTWDGRDDQGQPVADGEYRVVIQNLELEVTVDSTPPDVTVRFRASPIDIEMAECGVFPVTRLGTYQLSGLIVDPGRREFLRQVAFQRGYRNDERSWQDLGLAISNLGDDDASWTPVLDENTDFHPFEQVVEQQIVYRGLATDRAGNNTTRVALPESLLLIDGIGAHRTTADGFEGLQSVPYLDLGTQPNPAAQFYPRRLFFTTELRLSIAESIPDPTVQVFVDARTLEAEGDLPGAWQSIAVSQFRVPGSTEFGPLPSDHHSEFLWSAFGLPLRQQLEVRVRALDALGTEWTSNSTVVILEPVSLMGQVTDDDLAPEAPWSEGLLALLDQPGIDLGSQVVIWGLQNLPYSLDRVVLEVQSDDDANFNLPQRFNVTAQDDDLFVFALEGLDEDATYRFKAFIVQCGDGSGEVDVEVPSTPPSGPQSFLEVEVEQVFAEAECGAFAPDALLRMRVSGSSQAQVQRIEVFAIDALGAESSVFVEPQPEKNVHYTWTSDLVFPLSEKQRYQVRVTGWDPLTSSPLPLIVEEVIFPAADTPPEVHVVQPMAGQLVCLGKVGSRLLSMSVNGEIDYPGSFGTQTSIVWTNFLGQSLQTTLAGSFGERPYQPLAQEFGTFSSEVATGPAILQLKVGDDQGRYSCVDTPLFLDSLLEPVNVVSEDDIFSPNGDGAFDVATLRYESSELATLTMTVHPLNPDPDVLVGNQVLRTLLQDVVVEGLGNILWDGTTTAGQLLPDATYAVVSFFRDDCGHAKKLVRFLEIDNTSPQVAITSPEMNVGLGSTVQVIGHASDRNFINYSLDVMVEDEPWTQLATDIHAVHDTTLGLWSALYGEQASLRLSAFDKVGNSSQALVDVTIVEQGDLITFFEAVPGFFSPNGDGRLDTTTLRFVLSEAAIVAMTIETMDGTTVATLLGELQDSGSHLLSWDGTMTDNGAPVADGSYRVKLSASLSDPSFQQDKELSLEIDSTPPQVALSFPLDDAWLQGNESVQGTVSDLHLERYTLSLRHQDGSPIALATGSAERQDEALTFLDLQEDGTYELLLEATDLGESEAHTSLSFQVDTVPPNVSLTSPAEGSLLGAGGGLVDVRGTVIEDHLASYRLEAVPVTPAGSVRLIASSDSLPEESLLTQWDLDGLGDGTYELRLVAEDLAGWQSETTVTVEIDSTPPVVSITSPQADFFITEPLSILGSATDPNFAGYSLAVAPVGLQQFSEIHQQSDEVSDGLLADWQLLPPDGAYLLRLQAVDSLGNMSQTLIPVRVDVTPPAAPLALTAELIDDDSARLQWSPVPDPDLAGYRVMRGALPVTGELVTATQLVDMDLPTGTHVYTVVAVDLAALESEPSDPAQVVVDLDAPFTRLHVPVDGARVSGIVEVIGTAFSTDDFKEYSLSVAAGSSSNDFVELRRSPVPVQLDRVGQWSTLGLAEESLHRLRLESEDIHGNHSLTEIQVMVDNQPPAAPTGLAANVTLDDLDLTWNANSESDLLGYLLYRDGQLANAAGSSTGSLLPFVIPPSDLPSGLESYLDDHRPDGTYVYHLQAIDQAENVSPPSSSIQVVVETGPPEALISAPQDGHRFDQPLYVRATVVDHDVATVQLQVQPEGASTWSDLAPLDGSEPWDTTWQLDGVDFGTYTLRAVATDQGGLVDPAPTSIQVIHQDVTPPQGVDGLQIDAIDGGMVDLSWNANAVDSDLAGYVIDRRDGEGVTVRLNASPITGLDFSDTTAPDGLLTYTVSAVDTTDNVSEPSNEATGQVFTPFLEPIPTPTPQTQTNLLGSVPPEVAPADVEVTFLNGLGSQLLPASTTDGEGDFRFEDINLQPGSNTFTVVATDAQGHRSRQATLAVEVIARPTPPIWIDAVSTGNFVDLSWQANPESDVVGYFLFRDGERLDTGDEIPLTTAAASSSEPGFPASNVLVGGESPPRWLSSSNAAPVTDQWLQVGWTTPQPVSKLEISWQLRVRDFDIEVRQANTWVKVAEVRNNTSIFTSTELDLEIITQALRVVFRSSEAQAGMSRISVFESPLITGTSTTDGPLDGNFVYTLEALGASGFVSDPSLPLDVLVGNGPPQPVVLSGLANGSTVELAWTESSSSDLDRYEVFRDGQRIFTQRSLDQRTYNNTSRANGTYIYQVFAIDVNQQQSPSNELAITVAVEPPPAPVALTLVQGDNDRSLVLTWQPGSGVPTSRYEVARANVSGGPYLTIRNTSSLTNIDSSVVLDQTYFYIVRGLDSLGNAGAYSQEISGALEVSEELPAPVLASPRLDSGAPFETLNFSEVLSGTVDSDAFGLSVHVLRNGMELGTTSPRQRLVGTESHSEIDPLSEGKIWTSGDGARTAIMGTPEAPLVIYEWATEGEQIVSGLTGEPRWFADHHRLLFANDGDITAYDVDDGSQQLLAQTTSARLAVPSADGQHLAVVGEHDGVEGLWTVRLSDQAWALQLAAAADLFDLYSVQWSPDGQWLSYLLTTPLSLEIKNVTTGEQRLIEDDSFTADPSWSPDSSELTFVSRNSSTTRGVFRHILSTEQKIRVESNRYHPKKPRYSADSAFIGYWRRSISGSSSRASDLLYTEELANSRSRKIYDAGLPNNVLPEWDWIDSHYYFKFRDPDSGRLAVLRYGNTGLFSYSVPLDFGDNVITAFADDRIGRVSEISEPLVIRRLANRPDLEITASDIEILPTVPRVNAPSRVAMTVRNIGNIATATTDLSLLISGPGSTSTVLAEGATLPGLAAGEAATLLFDYVPTTVGFFAIEAIVDVSSNVVEASETNNRAVTTFQVVAETTPVIDIATERLFYGPQEEVRIDLEIFNPGDTLNGRVDLVVEDEDGFVVTELSSLPVAELPFSGTWTGATAWNTEDVFAGQYLIRAALLDESEVTLDESFVQVTVVPTGSLEAELSSDRLLYVHGETVDLEATVRYPHGNQAIEDALATLRIVDGNDLEVALWTQELGSLLPGSEVSIDRQWASTGVQEGLFEAQLSVQLDNTIVTGTATSFEIVDEVDELQVTIEKTVALSNDLDGSGGASAGDQLRYIITLNNTGNTVATQLVVLDELAQTLTWVEGSTSTSLGMVTSSTPLRIDIPALEPGTSAVITFEALIDQELPAGTTSIANQAVLDADQLNSLLSDDPTTPEPADATRITVVVAPELRLSKRATLLDDRDGDGAASPGDVLAYELTTTNVGSASATDLLLEDALPQHTLLVADSLSLSAGTVDFLADDFVAVALSELTPQATFTVSLAVEIAASLPGGVVELSNQALLSSLELPVLLSDDPNQPGSEDPTRTSLVAAPLLSFTKTVTVVDSADGTADAGSLLDYQLLVHNSGSQGATGLVLSDVLPEHTLLQAETVLLSAGNLDSSEPLIASLGELTAGESWTLSFQTQIIDPLPSIVDRVVNQALLTSFELPDLLSDDPTTVEAADPTVVLIGGQPGLTTLCEIDDFSTGNLDGWQVAYLGDASDGGAAIVDEHLQLSANGSSLYHGADNGVFIYRPLSSSDDFRIEVDVSGFPVDSGGQARKVALMLRSHLGSQAPRVMVTYVPHFPDPETRVLQFDFRAFEGDSGRELAHNAFDVPAEARLAIEKRGHHYSVYYSLDSGSSWVAPVGGSFAGRVELDLGEELLAGMVATSYDPATLFTAELDNFAVCRPSDGTPTLPPALTPCDPVQPLDMVFVLDLSGSMRATYPLVAGQGGSVGQGNTVTRLQAAQAAISELIDGMSQAAEGSRAALVTFAGFHTPAENLAAGAQVQIGLTEDLTAVADLVNSFQTADVAPNTTTPTSLALAESLDLLLEQRDTEHQPVMVLVTDGIPNIDALGRGPDAYELEELQAISLDDASGRFYPWATVGWLGNFNPDLNTFDGEPLANSMFEIERLELSLPELLIYGVALQGNGMDIGTFNQDLLDYAAYFSGARSFGADDVESLSAAIDVLATDLDCGGIGTASLGDRLWQDLDGDGSQDLDEPGINGVSLDLFDSWGFGITRVITEGDGEYSIDALPAGDYSMQVRAESLPPLVDVPTFDVDGLSSIDSATVSLSDGETRQDVDFGYRQRPPTQPTTACEDDTFEDPVLDADWQLVELGNADEGQVTVSNGELWLSGDGTSLFHGDDNGAFLHRPMTGDGRVEIDLTGFPVDQGGAPRKACLMVRDGHQPRDPRVMACLFPHLVGDNPGDPESTALQFDVRHTNGTAQELANLIRHIPLPVRLAIERRGDVFTVLYSRDDGAHWIQPLGQLGGQVEIAMSDTLSAGPAVASYDASQALTASFDRWSLCRPNPVLPFEPSPAVVCDPQAGFDVIYLLDMSSSMTAPIDDGSGGSSSRIEAASQALLQLHTEVSSGNDRRAALVVFGGHDSVQANIDDSIQVLSPMSGTFSQLEGQLQGLSASLIEPKTETPTALALRATLQLLIADSQGAPPAVVLVTDGVPTIDGLGRGPYDPNSVQSVSLRDDVGDFLSWGEVAWRGDAAPFLGTFTGEPLAHTMAALEEMKLSLPALRLYAITLRGDGSGLGVFHQDLQEYAAFVSGGLAFAADDLPALQTAIDDLGLALTCQGGA